MGGHRKVKRRQLLTASSVASLGLAMGTSLSLAASASSGSSSVSPVKKRILFLGGTGFIGPPMVRYAVERGHEVTIFTRGKTSADLPDVEQLIGDRTGDLDALKGRSWDVVLDNNARDYRWVKLTTELLRDKVEHYLFVSSISVLQVFNLALCVTWAKCLFKSKRVIITCIILICFVILFCRVIIWFFLIPSIVLAVVIIGIFFIML